MREYITPTITKGNFTKGKHYEVISDYPGHSLVKCDKGEYKLVKTDGTPSAHLDFAGKFYRVSFELNNALNIQAKADALARRIKIGKAHIGDAIMTSAVIENARISDGQIYKMVSARQHTNEYAEVLEQLREVLRVPEGENIVSHAKAVRILADGLISLQK